MSREKRSRRQFTTEQTAAILRRHLVDKGPVSELCTSSAFSRQKRRFDRTEDLIRLSLTRGQG